MRHSMLKAVSLALVLGVPTISSAAQAAKPATHAKQAAAKQTTATHEKRSDESIKDRIEHRFATNPMVRKYDLSANVSGGVATISGTVATEPQKMEAARLARVPGVTKVTNDVKIDKDSDKTLTERAKSGLSKTGEAITDTWITAKVKWFFVGEDLLKGSDISVDTKDHVVTLTGSVRSAAGRTRAVHLARETDGVTRVVDQLTVRPKTTH